MDHDRHAPEIDRALTFVNGRSLPDGDVRVTLDTPDRLIEWLLATSPPELSGSASPRVSPWAAREALGEAQRLQVAMNELFEAVSAGERVGPMTIHVINRAQSFATWSTSLVAEGTRLRTHRTLAGPGLLPALAAVAEAGCVLATVVPSERLRRCASAECARWFVDSSKGGRRRWCSMATCGNRAKAARYRARHSGS